MVEQHGGGPAAPEGVDRYQRLLEHLPVGVYRTSPDGQILEGNEALRAMLGLQEAGALTDFNVTQFYLEPDQRTLHLEQLSVDLTGFREFRFRTLDGRTIWVRDHPRAILDGAGRLEFFDGILIDVTELKQAELERETLIKDLQQALERIRTLAGLLPICASCKKIRDDQGYWEAVEGYLHKHSGLRFSHGLCPECRDFLFPAPPDGQTRG